MLSRGGCVQNVPNEKRGRANRRGRKSLCCSQRPSDVESVGTKLLRRRRAKAVLITTNGIYPKQAMPKGLCAFVCWDWPSGGRHCPKIGGVKGTRNLPMGHGRPARMQKPWLLGRPGDVESGGCVQNVPNEKRGKANRRGRKSLSCS